MISAERSIDGRFGRDDHAAMLGAR